jgi:hypothetical protein
MDWIFLYSTASRPILRPTQSPVQWVLEAIFQTVKRPGHEADNLLPGSAEVKKSGYIPLLPDTPPWRGV